MESMRSAARSAWLLLGLVAGAAVPSHAQSARRVQVGVHGNVSDDADLGLGADVRWQFLRSDQRLALVGSFDYFFPQDDDLEFFPADFTGLFDAFFRGLPDPLGQLPPLPVLEDFQVERRYWEANLDLTWDFGNSGTVVPYAGVGLNYARSRVEVFGREEEDDDIGANVLAGVRIARRVFVQAKKEAGGGDLFVVTAGVRF
jgi:hypothetical protein